MALMMNLENLAEWLSYHSFPCITHIIFGIDCPFCGFQRSFIALISGNLSASIAYFPALIPLLITAVVSVISLKIRNSYFKQIVVWMLIVDLLIVMLNWIVKLMFYIFS